MTHMLDTCICVSLIRKKSESLRRRFESYELGDLVVSSITEAELRFGAEKSRAPEGNHTQLDHLFLALPVLPFDRSAAVGYCSIRAALELSGNTIGPMDLLIAAHGRSTGLKLVTNNYSEFSRVPDLDVEDWS